MAGFLVFWACLLLHIWPPSLYWPRLLAWLDTASQHNLTNITVV